MVVINVAQENSQVRLEEILNRPNHLLLQDVSVDKILAQIVADSGLADEIDKIEQSLNFPQEFAPDQQSASRENSSKRKHETDTGSNKFEEEKEGETSIPRGLDNDFDKDEDDWCAEESEFGAESLMNDMHSGI